MAILNCGGVHSGLASRSECREDLLPLVERLLWCAWEEEELERGLVALRSRTAAELELARSRLARTAREARAGSASKSVALACAARERLDATATVRYWSGTIVPPASPALSLRTRAAPSQARSNRCGAVRGGAAQPR
jgi:hypothetical protein